MVALTATIGCGSGGGDGTPGGGGSTGHVPTDHVIVSGQAQDVPANTQLATGPFDVPAGATVTYVLVDTPTGVGFDTMDVAIIPSSMATSPSPVGYAVQQNVSSTNGTTPALPAGAYDLLVQCFNLADDCLFQATIDATY